MTKLFKDFHCHLLPAIDDGAVDLAESLAMARILAEFGFSQIYCTPHRIKGCYENLPERIIQTTTALQSLLDQASIDLRLIPGSEHYLDEFLIDQLPGALSVDRRYLLVELPFRGGGRDDRWHDRGSQGARPRAADCPPRALRRVRAAVARR